METKEELLFLPPGFRFHPSDEEIITYYLLEKVRDQRFNAIAMGEVDLNKCEPWELPGKAKMGVKEWYFFCQRERRYPTGVRTNRATNSGYWKATGKDREIHKRKGSTLVGMKKTLVFYKGRSPKGEKTNWVMHEFRLEGNYSHLRRNLTNASKDDWVVVRVFNKKEGNKTSPLIEPTMEPAEEVMNQSVFENHLLPPNPLSSDIASSSKLQQFSNSIMRTELRNDWNAGISSYDYLDNTWEY